MSQFFIGVTEGALPPNVPTSFVTDSGTIIPAGNIVIINGGQTTANNANGIQVVATPPGGNVEVVQLTNRITGTGTTSDGLGQTQTLYTFPLGAVAGTYLFNTELVAFDKTDSLGAGLAAYATVRTTGAAGVLIGSSIPLVAKEGLLGLPLPGLILSVQVNAVANTLSVVVTGLTGKTIDYFVLTTYIFVS
jgi:hypothetical protein